MRKTDYSKSLRITDLSNQGLTNRQIAIELDMKYATVCLLKRKMRDQGVVINSILGRPKKGYKQSIGKLSTCK